MGFQQGLSGLNAAAKNLDAIGNNVANAGTVGFKTSQVQFADVYAASLSGGGAGQVGLGTKTTSVAQQFTQGNISSSNNPLDVAINGGGFFRLDTNGTISYSRNGQFQLNKDGYVVSSTGAKVTGYGVDPTSGNIVATNPAPVNLPTADLPPQATGGSASAAGAKVGVNLDSREIPATGTFNPLDPTSYNKSTSMTVYDTLGNPHVLSLYFTKSAVTPSTWSLNANVDGTASNVPANYAAVSANTTALGTGGAVGVDTRAGAVQGLWAVGSPPYVAATNAIAAAAAATTAVTNMGAAPSTAALINAAVAAAKTSAAAMAAMNAAVIASPPAGAAQIAEAASTLVANTAAQTAVAGVTTPGATLSATQLAFDTSGKLTTTMPLSVSLDLAGISTALGSVNSAAAPLVFNLDFTGTSQYGSPFGVNALTQDGFSSGRLNGFNIGSDGIIQGRYSNGQSRSLGQIVLANFTNPNGLKPLGNNQWAETPDSNQPLIGTPGSGSLGVMQSGAVEESNVDLTAELVNMITAQRFYQANAQTIKTQDSIMQTIVNLR
ncbi:flagellar hook protein FlgE [Sulfuricella denitrificans skB26]|uniref:Flagellar hook protein FlgE n=1 Tax=Sulfuricella denitrificans (strain DSM 22764 / NBRC 105220 / skB26) TaxID=1163617 RepID=S6B4J0_SULDS|nr:flagellar hook protein FlgE [Sulfuricella denitrificans]BAN35522.1 flagellar hook protein FlgE [Sulfuricella denitrificans skB26]